MTTTTTKPSAAAVRAARRYLDRQAPFQNASPGTRKRRVDQLAAAIDIELQPLIKKLERLARDTECACPDHATGATLLQCPKCAAERAVKHAKGEQ